MENKIPLPTDNIYKFYALFGLLALIFSIGATIYIGRSTNELIFASSIEYETLNAIEKPTSAEIAKRAAIEKRVEIALADKTFLIRALSVIAGAALLSMIYGFSKWHNELQPIQDETTRLQLEKLRHEVRALSDGSSRQE